MTRKKLAVRYGILTVLLISLSLASTGNAWTLYVPKVATPDFSWYVDWWYGGIVINLSCGTPEADIRYTWKPGHGEALTPTSSSRLYDDDRPLLVTCIGQVKARGFKRYWDDSDVLAINIR